MLRHWVVFLCLAALVSGCDLQQYPEPEGAQKKEMLIYCGMTMIRPVMDVIELFEQQEDCRVKITYGGSGHLLRSVEVNRIGDLFFPGDASYIEELAERGLINATELIGYNQAAFFVPPGNPKSLPAKLDTLLDKQLNVVIGQADAGSIGRETERILSRVGIYPQVIDNALYLTTDSKGLTQAILNGDADLVVNWRAVAFREETHGKMELLPLSEQVAPKRPLVMGTLSDSQNPVLAEKFLQFVASSQGQKIFRNYGFRD